MKYFIIFLLTTIYCNCNVQYNTPISIQETEESIISYPFSVSYKYGKVLFLDKTGKMVFLYTKSGELIKTFTPEMRFSDSIAVIRDKLNDRRYVAIDEYLHDYPDGNANGKLKNALGNMYINCCFKDSETVTCGGIFGVLMKKPKYGAKEYGVTTEAMINEYNIKTDDIKSMPLPKPYEPYGVVKSQTMLYQSEKEVYIMDFSTSSRSRDDNIPFFFALSRLSKEGNFQKAFFEVPKVLQAPFLSDDFIRICATGDDSLWCAFPKITKIYNPESTSSFDLKLKNNTNHMFLDSMALLKGKYSEEIDKRIEQLYTHLRYRVESISNFNDDLLVRVRDRIDKKHILQIYTTKGEFLQEVIYEQFSEGEEIAGIAYSEDSEEFLFISMMDEQWYFTYKKAEEVF